MKKLTIKLLAKTLCKLRDHVVTSKTTSQVASIQEPGTESRACVIKLTETYCAVCGKIFGINPNGITYDSKDDEQKSLS